MAMQTVKTPFTNMTFTPDVPSSALSATEYNAGQNIETNVRGVNSVAGDEYILSQIPGNMIFVTSGFDINDIYWFIVATEQGHWYAIDSAGYTDITPSVGNFTGYNTSTVITASWNGIVVFLNDQINPPMYFEPGNWNQIRLYDNAPDYYVWNYDVGYNISGNAVPLYSTFTAGFLRVFNSPNLGSLLIAGNFTGNIAANVVPGGGTVQNLPTTIRWSQNFGLNAGPTTWAPTITNVANEVEIPARGPAIDGFPLNGNFYICSYWDTVLLSPISYTTTTAPVFGLKLVNQGRGMLNENCWCNVDNTVFGLDARDIWQFDGGNFKAIGNQRVKQYFYNNLNPSYTNQVFMEHNSAKYQIEIYYPDLTSTGQCNQMISYRYDLDAWQPPRQVTTATQATEAPRWTGTEFNLATRGVVYSTYATHATGTAGVFQNFISGYCTGTSGSSATSSGYWQVAQKSTSGSGIGLVLNIHINNNNSTYSNNASLYGIVNGGSGYQVGDTVTFSGAGLGGNNVTNDLTITISQVSTPSQVTQLIQKDTGTSFLGNAISSLFQRNNLSFGQPYSSSVLVHRVLPEVYGTGNVSITIGGNNSVASTPVYNPTVVMPIVTDNPWIQVDQNEARVVTMQVSGNSAVDTWQMTAANWQVTVVQDTR